MVVFGEWCDEMPLRNGKLLCTAHTWIDDVYFIFSHSYHFYFYYLFLHTSLNFTVDDGPVVEEICTSKRQYHNIHTYSSSPLMLRPNISDNMLWTKITWNKQKKLATHIRISGENTRTNTIFSTEKKIFFCTENLCYIHYITLSKRYADVLYIYNSYIIVSSCNSVVHNILLLFSRSIWAIVISFSVFQFSSVWFCFCFHLFFNFEYEFFSLLFNRKSKCCHCQTNTEKTNDWVW